MAKYVALLRGIGPGNPNMRNDKLRAVFEGLRFQNVQSVISSGNILFETDRTDIADLEAEIEVAIALELNFQTTAIIRSQKQLQSLVAANPYRGLEHGRETYLLVTFFKKPTKMAFELPYQVPDKPYRLVKVVDSALCSVTDTTTFKTPDIMTWLEKHFTKEISSRTWSTVQRILAKFE